MGVDAAVAVHQPDFGGAFLGLARLHTHRGEWDESVPEPDGSLSIQASPPCLSRNGISLTPAVLV